MITEVFPSYLITTIYRVASDGNILSGPYNGDRRGILPAMATSRWPPFTYHRDITKQYVYGFNDLIQFKNWFSINDLDRLDEHDFVLYIIEIPKKAVISDNNQCAFLANAMEDYKTVNLFKF
jgi:hypothetical protein